MVRRKAFLTPDATTGDNICRPLSIPLPLLPSFGGALAALTETQQWEQFGAVTPQEAAEACTEIVAAWYASMCGDGPATCEFPAPAEFDIDLTLKIIRRGTGGHTEELVNGEWVTPTGDYEVPPVPARTEMAEQDRLCLAAANAANVLALVYEEATDAWSIEHTSAAVFGAIFDIAIAIIGTFAGASAASYASLGKTAFDAFVETIDTLASDVWTNEFTDELTCFLYDHSTDTAGVVTFDWPTLRAGIFDKFLAAGAGLDTDRALLWGQVGYLFDILAAGGIDHAGTTTSIANYDCQRCIEPDCGPNYLRTGEIIIATSYAGWTPAPSSVTTICAVLQRVYFSSTTQVIDLGETRCIDRVHIFSFSKPNNPAGGRVTDMGIEVDTGEVWRGNPGNSNNAGCFNVDAIFTPVTTRFIYLRFYAGTSPRLSRIHVGYNGTTVTFN